MTSPDQFRAPPPPAVDSSQHAEELLQVLKNRGPRTGRRRTEYETLSAPFWADDLGTATPPGHWNVIAQDPRAPQPALHPGDRAALCVAQPGHRRCGHLLLGYQVFSTAPGAPRPASANSIPRSTRTWCRPPDFIPLMTTPAFPSYTSGPQHIFPRRPSRILEHFFGTDDIEFTVTSEGLPGAVRTFKKTFGMPQKKIGMSRVWGGIHVMSDNLAGPGRPA